MATLTTRRFSTLQRRVVQLERRLLPKPSPTGVYSERQYDMVRAFVVLAHAEVEHFLEELASDVLDAVKRRWDQSHSAGRCLSALLMYNDKRLPFPDALGKQQPKDSFEEVARGAIKKHREFVIRRNHGLKEANILHLYLPMGVLESDLDPLWLAAMTTFGARRGVVAHTSAKRVQSPLDPEAARSMVRNVLEGVELVEPVVLALRRS